MNKQIVLDTLDRKPEVPQFGVCRILKTLLEDNFITVSELDTIRDSWQNWKHHSGNIAYPIPSTNRLFTNRDIYWMTCIDKWDLNTEYGRLRHDLLQYTIKFIEENF
jgi:hypothetical protein